MTEATAPEQIEILINTLNSFLEKAATIDDSIKSLANQLAAMEIRQLEIEKASGYLLSKDPEWMKAFEAAILAESEGGTSETTEQLIIPE